MLFRKELIEKIEIKTLIMMKKEVECVDITLTNGMFNRFTMCNGKFDCSFSLDFHRVFMTEDYISEESYCDLYRYCIEKSDPGKLNSFLDGDISRRYYFITRHYDVTYKTLNEAECDLFNSDRLELCAAIIKGFVFKDEESAVKRALELHKGIHGTMTNGEMQVLDTMESRNNND